MCSEAGEKNEVKARNAYCSKISFVVRAFGLVVNPSLTWLGASPDGIVEDPSQKCIGLFEIKCPLHVILVLLKKLTLILAFLQPS